MFNLIRRISHGVIPRPDRPWEDDPTSNAPAKRKKRRMSSSEHGEGADGRADSLNKKMRGDSVASDTTDNVQEAKSSSPNDSKAVKEVTKGVNEVELADTAAATAVSPEAVPLPEEKSGELDEPTPPPTESPAVGEVSDDNASSVNEEPTNEHFVNGRSTDDSLQALEQAPEILPADDKGDATAPVEATTEAGVKKDLKESLPPTTQVDNRTAE